MKTIEEYKKWKEGHDIDWQIDEVHEFAARIGGSGLYEMFELAEKSNELLEALQAAQSVIPYGNESLEIKIKEAIKKAVE